MNKKTQTIFVAALLGCLLFSADVKAQFTRIGGGLTFSPGVDNLTYKTGNPGFSFRGVFELGDKFWAIPSLTFYIPKTKTELSSGDTRRTFFSSIDANVTYTLTTESTLLFYALGGVNLTGLYSAYKSDDPERENIFKALPGVNIGTGIEMLVADDINSFIQIKYVVGIPPSQYLVISVGVHYYITGRRYKSW